MIAELRLNDYLNGLDEQLAALDLLAQAHGLQITQLLSRGFGEYAVQFVYRPADNPTYEKFFPSVWCKDLGQLFAQLRETLEDETMNIFSTNLFEFLSGDMIGDKEITLTIKDVEEETLTNSRGSEDKPIVTFTERKKKWALNKTNARVLAERLGPETNDWRGHRVVLHAENVSAFGKSVKAIRISSILPPVKEGKPNGNGNGRKTTIPQDYSAQDANEDLIG